MAGELTVTVVGTYNTIALAVAAMDAGTDPAATDYHKLIIEPGVGSSRYVVIKSVRAS